MERGAYGIAKTCFPPQTIPAWICIFTGVNPGKHGVFSFFNTMGGRIRLNTALNIRFPPVYEIFSLLRRPIALINVPLSYPFPILYGVGVSDWLAPRRICRIKLPKATNIIRDIVDGYTSADPHGDSSPRRRGSLRRLMGDLKKKLWIIEGLMELEYIEDYFIVVSELDWIFHRYYGRVVRGEVPRYVRRILRLLDKMVSRVIRKALRRGMDIFVVSDHGFRTYSKIVCINEILRKLGYAKGVTLRYITKKGQSKRLKSLIKKAKKDVKSEVLRTLWHVFLSSGIARGFSTKIYDYIMHGNYRILVDNRRSIAFALMNVPAFFIAINRRIKRRDYVAMRLINKLRRLRDKNGRKIFSLVEHRNTLYSGPYVHYAPHIGIFGNPDAGYIASAILTGSVLVDRKTNYHDFDAIFIAYTSNQRIRGDLGVVSIYDIAPTIMATQGIPIQKGLDGRNLIANIETKKANYVTRWSIARKLFLAKTFRKTDKPMI